MSNRRHSIQIPFGSQYMVPVSPQMGLLSPRNMVTNPMFRPLQPQGNSISGLSHETCNDITKVGIIFYNEQGILLAKKEVPRRLNTPIYNQYNMLPYNHIQGTFTQYSIPHEPISTDERIEQACERIFERITKTKLNNKKETEEGQIAKAHKRRHTDNTCSMIIVIKTTQKINTPENYTFMSYNDISEITKRPNDRKLLDYKLFADLIREGRLIENGHEKTVPDGSSDDEIKKALNKVFEIPSGKDMNELVKIVKAYKILDERLNKRSDVLDDDDFVKYMKILRIKGSDFYKYKSEPTSVEIEAAIKLLFVIESTSSKTILSLIEEFRLNKEKDEDPTITEINRKKNKDLPSSDEINKNLKILKVTSKKYIGYPEISP